MRPWKPIAGRVRKGMRAARHKEALKDYRRQRTDELTRRLTIWRQQEQQEHEKANMND